MNVSVLPSYSRSKVIVHVQVGEKIMVNVRP